MMACYKSSIFKPVKKTLSLFPSYLIEMATSDQAFFSASVIFPLISTPASADNPL